MKFGASSAKLAAAQKMHKAISAMRASIKPVNKILDAAVAAEVQISEAETSTHQSQKKFKKKADRLEAQEHESHSEKLVNNSLNFFK